MAQPDRRSTTVPFRSGAPQTASVQIVGRSGADALIRVVGRLDEHAAPRVARELAAASRLPRRGPPRLVLDLSGLSYLDEAGLQVLLDLQDRLMAASGALELQSPSAAVVRLLHETYLQGSARRPERL